MQDLECLLVSKIGTCIDYTHLQIFRDHRLYQITVGYQLEYKSTPDMEPTCDRLLVFYEFPSHANIIID